MQLSDHLLMEYQLEAEARLSLPKYSKVVRFTCTVPAHGYTPLEKVLSINRELSTCTCMLDVHVSMKRFLLIRLWMVFELHRRHI